MASLKKPRPVQRGAPDGRGILIPLSALLILLAIALLPSPAQAPDQPRNIHLTWMRNDTARTIVVTWQTSGSASGDRVLYDVVPRGGNPSLYAYSATGTHHTYPNAGGYVHQVELTGLQPDTTYYFICGGEGGYSQERAFRTAPATSKSFTFAVWGDTRSGAADWPIGRDETAIAMASKGPAFAVHVADYVREGETDQAEWDNLLMSWQEYLVTPGGLTIPLIPSIGNHEGNGTIYHGQFALPGNERWYSLDYGPDLHIIVLSTQDPIGGEQYEWLRSDLENSRSRRWKVVVFHEPPYTSSPGHSPRYDIRSLWCPLFDQYHVDLVFNGHLHNYERTLPIRENRPVSSPENGTIYIVTGGGGAPLHENGWSEWTAFSRSAYEFVTVEVVGDKALIVRAHDMAGEVFDSVVIGRLASPLEPAGGSPIADPTPTFIWENYTSADGYEVWVDENPDFSSPELLGSTTENSYTARSPLSDGSYYWRVVAVVGGSRSPSEIQTFVVDTTAPPAPSPLSPAEGENLSDSAPTLVWSTVSDPGSGVLRYEVWVDSSPDFHAPRVENVFGTSWTPPILSDGVYYWRVRAWDSAGNAGGFSPVRSFRVDTVPPAAPLLISPADGENLGDSTPALSWREVPENSLPVLYRVSVSDSPSFAHENRSSGWVASTSWEVSPALPDGVWYWRVAARDNAGNISSSVPRMFVIFTGDFSVSLQPESVAVGQGKSTTAAVTISPVLGFSQTVVLSILELPGGVTAFFSPQSGTPPFTSTLTISAGSAVGPGTYSVVVTAAGGGKIHQATLTLKVEPPSRPLPLWVIAAAVAVVAAAVAVLKLFAFPR